MNSNNTIEAERISRKLISLRPDMGRGYSNLGYTLIVAEKYEEAEPVLEEAAKLNPLSLVWGYVPLGYVYSITRRYQQAKEHHLKALNQVDIPSQEKTILLLHLMWNAELSRDYAHALVWADSAIHSTFDYSYKIWALVTKANVKLQQGNYSESEDLLREALSTDTIPDPFFIIAKVYLGLIAEERGDAAAAEDFFKQAEAYGFLMGGGGPQGVLYHHGAFLLRQNRPEEAWRKWEQLVHEFPRNYYGYYGLALYHAKQGNKTLALDYLEKSLDYWYPVPLPILEEPLFKKIRKTKRFKALMKKHFNLAL